MSQLQKALSVTDEHLCHQRKEVHQHYFPGHFRDFSDNSLGFHDDYHRFSISYSQAVSIQANCCKVLLKSNKMVDKLIFKKNEKRR